MRPKIIYETLLLIFLSACSLQKPNQTITSPPSHKTIEEQSSAVQYSDLGEAPELRNTIWLNTGSPLRLGDLRGKVILLDMWTFG